MTIDDDMGPDRNGAGRVVWFALGALAVSAAVALFLYADGHFSDGRPDARLDETRTIIESRT